MGNDLCSGGPLGGFALNLWQEPQIPHLLGALPGADVGWGVAASPKAKVGGDITFPSGRYCGMRFSKWKLQRS